MIGQWGKAIYAIDAFPDDAWWEEINFDYVERLKTPRLEQDLIALDATVDELAKNPRCGELPELAAISQALGCLYVIEGATLGGRTITRHLQPGLRPVPRESFGG